MFGQWIPHNSIEDTIEECELVPLFQEPQCMLVLVIALTSGGSALTLNIAGYSNRGSQDPLFGETGDQRGTAHERHHSQVD